MIAFSRPIRLAMLLGVIAIGVVAALYIATLRNLAAARHARRSDQCATAENYLAACWRLPGIAAALALEHELLGVQQGDLRNEKTWQAKAARRSPDSVPILEALAKGNLAASQFTEARKYADAILQRQPEHAHALWLRGRALVRLQQEPQGRADLERAVALTPDAFEIRLSLAELLHKLGHVRAALAHYEQLRAQQPGDERVALAQAHGLQEEALLDDAQKLLDTLLLQRPDSLAVLLERSRLALRLGHPEQWLGRARKLNPDRTDINSLLRLCLQAQGKTDTELERSLLENDQRQADLRLKLHDSGREPALLTEFGRWIIRTGDKREAIGWFYAALKEDSTFAPAHAALADVFATDGQVRRATQHAQQAGVSFNKAANAISSPTALSLSRPTPSTASEALPAEATSEEVHRLCAACHAYPPPDSMPREAWRKEVKQGYDLLRASSQPGEFLSLENVVLYYESRAPERLPMIQHPPPAAKMPIEFEKRGSGWMVNLPPYPGVANVNLCRLFGTEKQELLVCETRLDRVLVLKPYESSPGGQALPQVIAPSHTAVTDLDGDCRPDILVASLGNFFPTDDKVGKVVWFRAGTAGSFEATTLLEGVGRVSDVQAADFNGDGRLDLVVAVFGWRTTGEILYLENETTDWSSPRFARREVDPRHGAIHVPVVDLNHDGKPDFLALISQEHESVVAYLNDGKGAFKQETIFAAPHPNYGSSGIEVVDLDDDGDADVLLTNGDVLDRPYLLKPYHGVQWLENEGAFPFKHHPLAPMYGASRAVAADFDGDQDLDVAAVSFLPRLEFPERERLKLPSVVLFEQTAKREFAMHVLEAGACDHFSCAAGDWDGDGKADLAVGNFSWKRSQPFGDAAILWRNVTD